MIPVPSATPGLPATWILQQGEHPYCIARRFNIHPADLLEANNLSADARPDEGTELKIPANAAPWPGATRSLMAHPDRWTVDPGDTVYKIACAYGDVDPNAIIYANGLQAPYTLEVGQVLNIP
jgi:peptidoglycan endopeptidase LytF